MKYAFWWESTAKRKGPVKVYVWERADRGVPEPVGPMPPAIPRSQVHNGISRASRQVPLGPLLEVLGLLQPNHGQISPAQTVSRGVNR